MKKTFSLFLMVALLSLSLTALAAGTDYQKWVGVGVNYNFQPSVNQTFTDGVTGNLQYSPSVGGGIEVGYKMQQYGVRARYDYYSANGSLSFSNLPAGTSVSAGSISGNIMDYYAQAMAFMPINAAAEGYLAVGLGGISQTITMGNSTATPAGGTPEVVSGTSASTNAFGIPISIGGNYFFAEKFAVNVDLTYMISTNTNNVASYFTPQVGLKYTF